MKLVCIVSLHQMASISLALLVFTQRGFFIGAHARNEKSYHSGCSESGWSLNQQRIESAQWKDTADATSHRGANHESN